MTKLGSMLAAIVVLGLSAPKPAIAHSPDDEHKENYVVHFSDKLQAAIDKRTDVIDKKTGEVIRKKKALLSITFNLNEKKPAGMQFEGDVPVEGLDNVVCFTSRIFISVEGGFPEEIKKSELGGSSDKIRATHCINP